MMLAQRLVIILLFAFIIGVLCIASMRATPRKGLLRVVEQICIGVILCYLCSAVLAPFGIKLVNSPAAAVSAGYLGLPGVALMVFARLFH